MLKKGWRPLTVQYSRFVFTQFFNNTEDSGIVSYPAFTRKIKLKINSSLIPCPRIKIRSYFFLLQHMNLCNERDDPYMTW